MVSSEYMLVVIAFERYNTLLNPTKRNQHHNKVIIWTSVVAILAFIFTASTFFEVRTVNEDTHVAPTQIECNMRQILSVEGSDDGMVFTKLYRDPIYWIYSSVIYTLLITGLIPITSLIYFYTKIYIHIRRHNLQMNRVLDKKDERQRKKEHDLAGIFGGYVITFLACHTPRVLYSGIKMLMYKEESNNQLATDPLPPWKMLLAFIFPVILALNSATNVVIYASLSTQFREECKKVFMGVWRRCCKSSTDNI